MSTRIGLLKIATFVVTAVAALAPAAQAQTNRGQVVQAVVKLNNAQLSLAKKLADDPQFAAQIDKAASSGNYDAVAELAASVTGLSKSNIHAGPGNPGGDDHDAASTATTQSVYSLASLSRRTERKMLSGKICFDVGFAQGCIAF